MDQAELEYIVKQLAGQCMDSEGTIEFYIDGRRMYLISDSRFDRMRIITPIASFETLTQEQIKKALEANFHSALDARYALSKNTLYAAFIHPLSSLQEHQIRSAVFQVFNLASSFGSQYTSGSLTYGDEVDEIVTV